MKLHIVFLAAALGLATTAFGATPAPGASTGGMPMKGGMCQKNAQECQQLAGKFDQWCSANADKCMAMKAHMEKRREWCEANKEKCEKMMHRMHEHMRDHNGDQGGDSDEGDASTPPA